MAGLNKIGDKKVVDSIDFKVVVYNRRCIASHHLGKTRLMPN
jgi:hypothetical protein